MNVREFFDKYHPALFIGVVMLLCVPFGLYLFSLIPSWVYQWGAIALAIVIVCGGFIVWIGINAPMGEEDQLYKPTVTREPPVDPDVATDAKDAVDRVLGYKGTNKRP